MNGDLEALGRLREYVEDALAAQSPHIADQLRAALRDGRTSLRIGPDDAGNTVVTVFVDGNALTRVDLRNLVPLDDV